MPSADLSNLQDVEIPTWLQKFAEFCKPVIDFFKAIIEKCGPVAGGIMIIVGALAGFFIIKSIIKLIKSLMNPVKGITVDFTGFFNALGKAAIAIAVLAGLALVINSISGLIDSFSKSGMTLGEVAGLLGIILGELALAFIVLLGAMKLLTPSWESIAGAAVILAGFALVIFTVSNLIDTFAKSGLKLNDVIGLMATVLISIVALMASVAIIGPLMTAGLVPFIVVVAAISAVLIVMAATIPTILDACGKFINKIAPVLKMLINEITKGIQGIILVLGITLPPILNAVGQLFEKIFKRNRKCCKNYIKWNCKYLYKCF